MKSKQPVSNISELVNAATFARKKFGTTWWRGQASSTWKLIPKIHRKITMKHHEISLAAHFKTKARTRHSMCPSSNDYASWLFLMQHYRLPTRLLDWSESPLIALFFAVAEMLNEPGSLYALDPRGLNRNQTGEDGIMTADYYKATLLFNAALETKAPRVSQILAIGANQVDSRMLAQASQFTIHGTPTPLESLNNSREFLIRFEIPEIAKQNIRDELFAIGIRESVVFPDLEHLAHELEERYGIDKLEDR